MCAHGHMIPPSQSMCAALIDQDQAKVHRTLFQVFYCQPSPSKHHTPKPVVSLWRRAKCQLVIAMFTAKKLCKWQACRHPRSNVPTLWTLNWKLVAPRSNLGVNPHISGPSVPSLGERADMDYVSVATDACCGGKGVSHEPEDIELLNQNLLCISQDEADCQTGLELSCSECNQV